MDYSLLVGVHHKADSGTTIENDRYAIDLDVPEGGSSSTSSSEAPKGGRPRSTHPKGSGRRVDVVEMPHVVYYFGIIDILQPYNVDKKLERFAKIYFRCKDGSGISSAEPRYYGRRFVDSIQRLLE